MSIKGLGSLLVREGLLTEQDKATISRSCGQSSWAFAKSVLAMGMLDEDELAAFFAERTHYRVAPRNLLDQLDPEVLHRIDANLLARLEILPLKWNDKLLTIAVADPLDKGTLHQLEFFTGVKTEVLVAPLSQIYIGLRRLIPDFEPHESELSQFLSNHAASAWQKQRIDEEIEFDETGLVKSRKPHGLLQDDDHHSFAGDSLADAIYDVFEDDPMEEDLAIGIDEEEIVLEEDEIIEEDIEVEDINEEEEIEESDDFEIKEEVSSEKKQRNGDLDLDLDEDSEENIDDLFASAVEDQKKAERQEEIDEENIDDLFASAVEEQKSQEEIEESEDSDGLLDEFANDEISSNEDNILEEEGGEESEEDDILQGLGDYDDILEESSELSKESDEDDVLQGLDESLDASSSEEDDILQGLGDSDDILEESSESSEEDDVLQGLDESLDASSPAEDDILQGLSDSDDILEESSELSKESDEDDILQGLDESLDTSSPAEDDILQGLSDSDDILEGGEDLDQDVILEDGDQALGELSSLGEDFAALEPNQLDGEDVDLDSLNESEDSLLSDAEQIEPPPEELSDLKELNESEDALMADVTLESKDEPILQTQPSVRLSNDEMDDFYDDLEDDYSEDLTTITPFETDSGLEEDLNIQDEQAFEPLDDDIELDADSLTSDLIADPDEEDLSELEDFASTSLDDAPRELEVSDEQTPNELEDLAWEDAEQEISKNVIASDESVAQINQALLKVSFASKLSDAVFIAKNVISTCVESGLMITGRHSQLELASSWGSIDKLEASSDELRLLAESLANSTWETITASGRFLEAIAGRSQLRVLKITISGDKELCFIAKMNSLSKTNQKLEGAIEALLRQVARKIG